MHPVALLALLALLGGAVLCLLRPAWTLPWFAFLIYARIPDSLRVEYGLPSAFMFLAPALVAYALARRIVLGEVLGEGWKSGLWWLAAWGAVCGASFLYAADPARTAEAFSDFIDATLIVLIVTLFLRDRAQLEPLVWALLAAGVFLSLPTLHQQLTGNWASTYGGFAYAEMRHLVGSSEGLRSGGPVTANYFALVLVALVPLAADRLLHADSRAKRTAGGISLALLLGAIGATYSRGGFLTLAGIAFLMLLTTPRWPRVLLAGAVIGVLALPFLPESYVARMASFGQVWDGLRGRQVEDSAIRGRLSEVRSALMMFGEHPLLGVGTGHYELHYPLYARGLGLDGRREERQAHSLYMEVAAENGLLGLAVFGGMLGTALVGVARTRRRLRERGDDEPVQLVTALGIGFAGYLAGSLFLHLSYPRFFWLQVAVAMGVRALAPAPQPAPVGAPLAADAGAAAGEPACG